MSIRIKSSDFTAAFAAAFTPQKGNVIYFDFRPEGLGVSFHITLKPGLEFHGILDPVGDEEFLEPREGYSYLVEGIRPFTEGPWKTKQVSSESSYWHKVASMIKDWHLYV